MIDEYRTGITEEYTSGGRIDNIAKKYGYNPMYVSRKLKEWNVTKRKIDSGVPLGKDEEQEICRLYNDQTPMEDIASLYYICVRRVRRVLIENNIKIRKKGGSEPIQPINKKRLSYLINHYTNIEIAEMLEISTKTLKKWIENYDIGTKKISDQDFKNAYMNLYYNKDGVSLMTFNNMIGKSMEYTRKKQIKLNLPRKSNKGWFNKINNEYWEEKKCKQ